MPDPSATPPRRSALAGHVGPAPGTPPDLGLREHHHVGIAAVLGAPAPETLRTALGLADTPTSGGAVGDDTLRLLWTGPDQYLAVSDTLESAALCERLEAAMPQSATAVVDLGQARTVLELQGACAEAVLAKGCPLDLEMMPPGAATPSVLGHLNVLLHRLADDHFRCYVFRSFGLSCHEWLCQAGREYGLLASE